MNTNLPQPLRDFHIGVINQYNREVVSAHQVRVGPNGELEIFVVKGTISWLVAAYGPGRWTSITVDPPSDDAIAEIESYLDRVTTQAQQYSLAAAAIHSGQIGRA